MREFSTVGLLLCLLAAVVRTESNNTTRALQVSAPDIYPDEQIHDGHVWVQMVANAKDCDIFYTLDGSDPTRETGTLYTTKFLLYQPGTYRVKAVAIPGILAAKDHRIASTIQVHEYTVKATSMPLPVVVPDNGHFRGRLTVEVSFASPLAAGEEAVLQYIKKDDTHDDWDTVNADDQWVTYSNKDHVQFIKMGVYHLFVRSYSPKNQSQSAVARLLYYIDPPLVYDVSTECATCHDTPTAREWFTVTVQNAKAQSRMFLSYSENCPVGGKQMIEGTGVVSISRHRTNAKFRSLGQCNQAYVCVREGADGQARAIPRRGASDKWFKINPSLKGDDSAPLPPPPPGVPVVNQNIDENDDPRFKVGHSSSQGFGSITLLVLWLIAIALIFYVVRIGKKSGPMGWVTQDVSAPSPSR